MKVPYNYELLAMDAPQPDKDTPVWQSLIVVSFFMTLTYGIYHTIQFFGQKYGQAYEDAGYGPQRAGPVPYIQNTLPHPDHLLKHPFIKEWFG